MSSKTNSIDLSIVIPALNEETRIGKTLDELSKFIKSDKTMRAINIEVLIVSADGTDNTHKIARIYANNIKNFHLLLPGKKVGKGRDVQFGMLRSKGDYAIYMDADLATPLSHLSEFYKIAKRGSDVVVATRNIKKHHSKPLRRLLSISGNIAFRVLGGVWTEDSQCGFKLFSRDAIDTCFSRQTIMKWGFDMELLTIAATNSLRVNYVRVDDWQDQPGGTFEAGRMSVHAIDTLRDLVVIARNRVLQRYN